MKARSIYRTIPSMFFLAMALVAILASPASAHHRGHSRGEATVLPGGDRIPGQPDFKRVGKTTMRFLPAKGEYEVRRGNEPPSYVHRDTELILSPEGEETGGSYWNLPTSELDPVCRTSGRRVVPVYTHRPEAEGPTPTELIRSIVRRMNWKIADQSSQSSEGHRVVKMAVDCDEEGEISVYDVEAEDNSYETIYEAVVSELFGTPTGDSAVKYMAFEDSVGGLGGGLNDATKGPDSLLATRTTMALASAKANHTTIHEAFHMFGASIVGNPPPPFSSVSGASHCIDGFDMLCYNDGGAYGGEQYSTTRCPESEGYKTSLTLPIDCGNDTYFDADPEPGSWLDRYWNVAGPENPFLVAPPTEAATEKASLIGAHSARLNGSVDPEGYDVTYRFEYGTSEEYGSEAEGEIEFGGDTAEVEISVKGLEPETTYHYRLHAESDSGSSEGEDETFTTGASPLPTAATEAAGDLGARRATLTASVNPEGSATSYQFQYTDQADYEENGYENASVAPASPAEAGAGSSEVVVEEVVKGLEPGTAYRFRVKAANTEGTTYGEDETFTTLEAEWALQEAAPTEAVIDTFDDVSCVSDSECIAVGSIVGETGFLAASQRWDGTEWSTLTNVEGTKLTDVSCASASLCLAVPKRSAQAQLWDGEAWEMASLAEPAEAEEFEPRDVSCASVSACIAVGTYKASGKWRPFSESWDGSEWSLLSTPATEGPGDEELNAVSCASAESCVAIGQTEEEPEAPQWGGLALGWDGSEWSALASPEAVAREFSDISCTSSSACTAVFDAAQAEHWDGEDWSAAMLPAPAGGKSPRLRAVSCVAEDACVAVGTYAVIDSVDRPVLAEVWADGKWQAQKPPVTAEDIGGDSRALHAISCSSSDHCAAVGTYTTGGFAIEPFAERYAPTAVPSATTEAATEVGAKEATLNATVNPQGQTTTYQFRYIDHADYEENGYENATSLPASPKGIGSGTANVEVSETATGLEPGRKYHFRVKATNSKGTTYGEDETFYTPTYRFDYEFGEEGEGEGQFGVPQGLDTDSEGNVYVADFHNDRVQKFDSEGEYLSQFGETGSGNGQFKYPTDIAIDSEGNIYVTDSINTRVQKFDSEGNYLSQFGEYGTGEGQFEYPFAVSTDAKDNVFVCDTALDRVEKFDSEGNFITQFGEQGTGEGQLKDPHDVAVGKYPLGIEAVFVADSTNDRVQVFLDQEGASDGLYLDQIGEEGTEEGQFSYPVGMDTDPAGDLYVYDTNGRIQRFTKGSGPIEVDPAQLGTFGSLAIGSENTLWAASASGSHLERWSLRPLPGPLLGAAEFPAPLAVSGPAATFNQSEGLNATCAGGGEALGGGNLVDERRGEITLAFDECKGPLGIVLTSPGQPEGTIVTNALMAEPAFLDAAQSEIGLLLAPQSPDGVFAEFSGAFIGSVVVTGSVIVSVTDIELEEEFSELSFTTEGPQQIEGTGPEYGLEMSVGGGAFATATFANEGTVTLEEGEAAFVPVE